jgi:hypothetical protein
MDTCYLGRVIVARILVAFFVVCTLQVFAKVVDGHADPAGDEHPKVVVEQGLFSVYFSNNRKNLVFRSHIDKAGIVVEAPQVVPAMPQSRPVEFDKFPEFFYAFRRAHATRHGDDWVVFPRWWGTEEEK